MFLSVKFRWFITFSKLTVQLDEYLTWQRVAKPIVLVFFPTSLFSPLYSEILKSIIVKSRDSCWEHGSPIIKLSLKCFEIVIYHLNINLFSSFLNWGFQGFSDICCVCRDDT